MKKYLFYLPLIYLIFIACSPPNDEKIIIKNEIKNENEILEIEEVKSDAITSKLPEEQDLSNFNETQFILTLEHKINTKKNNIYCVTMLYAWDAIKTEINADLTINKDLKDLTLLNNSTSFNDVLKQNEYTVNTEIIDNEIKAKAEFSKMLPFKTPFNSNYDITFNGQKVDAFGCWGSDYEYYNQVDILYYENDKHFVVQLNPINKSHTIILYKSSKIFSSMGEYLEALNKVIELGKKEHLIAENDWKFNLNYDDQLRIPKFSFNISTDYPTLVGNTFITPQSTFKVLKAWQRTAFHLDEGGAIIESEAEMYTESISIEEEENVIVPKKIIFDKPFLILTKRTDATTPYFCMWVANSELMIKK